MICYFNYPLIYYNQNLFNRYLIGESYAGVYVPTLGIKFLLYKLIIFIINIITIIKARELINKNSTLLS